MGSAFLKLLPYESISVFNFPLLTVMTAFIRDNLIFVFSYVLGLCLHFFPWYLLFVYLKHEMVNVVENPQCYGKLAGREAFFRGISERITRMP